MKMALTLGTCLLRLRLVEDAALRHPAPSEAEGDGSVACHEFSQRENCHQGQCQDMPVEFETEKRAVG